MTLTAAVMFNLTILYAVRSGDLYYDAGRWDRAVRVGMGLLLIAFTTGLIERARRGDTFEWFHALILAAALIALVAYVGLMFTQRAALHALAHRLGALKACDNPDCGPGRVDVAKVAGRDHADH